MINTIFDMSKIQVINFLFLVRFDVRNQNGNKEEPNNVQQITKIDGLCVEIKKTQTFKNSVLAVL